MPTPKKPVTAVAAERLTEGLGAARKQLLQVEKEIVTEAKKQRKSLEAKRKTDSHEASWVVTAIPRICEGLMVLPSE